MPRARSADIPRYDTYPAPAPSEAASTPQDWPYEPKTDVDVRTIGNPRLVATAEQLGEALGRAVALARSVPRRIENLKKHAVIRGSGPAVDAIDRVSDLGEQARARMQDLRGRVEDQLRGAQRAARENPLQVIAGAALAGLALGVALRLWRSSHV